MKLASLSLAALLILISPALADDPTPPANAMCFPVGVTIATSPAKETQRLEGKSLENFKAGLVDHMKQGADPIPADADLIILFKVNEKITAFAVTKGGCTLGTGVLPNKLIDEVLGRSI